ncbi:MULTISPECIES: hypothetical protein [unclassified Chamaesiphon]|uniref:hypothetical protein n=1 Tax=unclassified Chamaesiphon TaxID=2620921 RepID=UPI00286C8B85|nr:MULTISPECIES: hypothetical protein [unclassified Chamaesiphon]
MTDRFPPRDRQVRYCEYCHNLVSGGHFYRSILPKASLLMQIQPGGDRYPRILDRNIIGVAGSKYEIASVGVGSFPK